MKGELATKSARPYFFVSKEPDRDLRIRHLDNFYTLPEKGTFHGRGYSMTIEAMKMVPDM